MATQALQMTHELDQARRHYRDEVILTEKLEIMDRATEELIRSGVRSTSLKEGDRVEDFILMDAHGSPLRLQQMLSEGPVVVAFYRGGWCPYCNIELRGLQREIFQRQSGGSEAALVIKFRDEVFAERGKFVQSISDFRFPISDFSRHDHAAPDAE